MLSSIAQSTQAYVNIKQHGGRGAAFAAGQSLIEEFESIGGEMCQPQIRAGAICLASLTWQISEALHLFQIQTELFLVNPAVVCKK